MSGYDEMMTGQGNRLSGKPNSVKTEKSVGSETQGMNMSIAPTATSLNKAVTHLNRETQRGEHAPTVGGFPHDHTMR